MQTWYIQDINRQKRSPTQVNIQLTKTILTKLKNFWNQTSKFIYSFIKAISISPLQVHYYPEALPTQPRILCRSFTPKRHRQVRVKDLPKVPTWRLAGFELTTLRPTGTDSTNAPLRPNVLAKYFFLYLSKCISAPWFSVQSPNI